MPLHDVKVMMGSHKRQFCIFVVDDEPDICNAVSQTLTEISCEVTCFIRAMDCLQAITRHGCDLLISDVSMPQMNGIELLKAVKQFNPMLPVLLISGFAEIPLAVEAIKAGAVDFLEKPLDEDNFLSLVRNILDQVDLTDGYAGKPLTKTEKRILQQIVDGMGNKQIAYKLQCSVRTVENHRYRLMRKLNVDCTASLVRIALSLGLVSSDHDSCD